MTDPNGAAGDSSQCCEDLGNEVKCPSAVYSVTTTCTPPACTVDGQTGGTQGTSSSSTVETPMANRVVYGPASTFNDAIEAWNQPYKNPGYSWHVDLLL